MKDIDSLAHTKWRCQYHIVFAPKYRRQIIYGKYKAAIGKILRRICERCEGVEIIEANACEDHIHMLVTIPPKLSVTIPTDESFVEGTKEIMAKWGADAVRDCDGTRLPTNAKELGKVYNTYFIVRGDNEWARKHPEEAQRIFLLSERVLAVGNSVKIPFMTGFLRDQFDPDYTNIERWQVVDRTTGECLPREAWNVNEKKHEITILKAKKMHAYTVSFLARVTWHPVQVYNYITNNWTCEKQLTYDPAYPATKEYVKRNMREWCESNPDTDVVRFTTFLYQFTLIFNEQGKEKNVEWFGYAQTANPVLIDAFAKATGIQLTAEDFIDNGYYNNAFRSPTDKFRKWQDFIARFVSEMVRELVDICHEYGKEAMMFLGDDWIGAEPYALPNTEVLDIAISDRFKRSVNVGEVKTAVNAFGKGRSFYITGLPYSFQNSRLLYKAIVWCAGKDLYRAYADNVNVECNYYHASGKYALVNNGKDTQTTDFYDIHGNKRKVTLQPMEIRWIKE